MLTEDLPVILCIPMLLFEKDKKAGVSFYQEEGGKLKKVCTVSAHYVMVTGIMQEQGSEETFLEISSWGKKYYVNWKEHEKLMRTHFLGTILGNIMYIRSKRN